ncbi:hypothetical protein [Streptomyces antibioticus]|uniref:hypothetical protein n=1 Tax=Streptomyces antibioticus TaxID=1890 RepID=UPI0036FAE61E
MRIGITKHCCLSHDVGQQARALLAEAIKTYDASDLIGVSCVADGPDAWFTQTFVAHGGQSTKSTNSSPFGTTNPPAAAAAAAPPTSSPARGR